MLTWQVSREEKGRPYSTMANTSKSSSKPRILYAEGDSEVLASQSVTIEKAGYNVTQAEGRKQVQDILRQEKFDLVILGPTLTKNDRHHLPYVIKKAQSATRVLVMHTDGERHPAVDANIDTGRSMADVVAKIAALVAGDMAPQSLAKGAAAGK